MQGPPGDNGMDGEDGISGPPGELGEPGLCNPTPACLTLPLSGVDAAYCPCPRRQPVMVNGQPQYLFGF